MYDRGQISFVFGQGAFHCLVISYANIYLKAGTMQNKVLNINKKLTNLYWNIFNTFEEITRKHGRFS